MSMFKGFSIQFFVCIWFGLFSVSNAVEAKIAKRLKYESQPTHYMEKHIPRDTFIQKRRASGSQMHEVVIAVHQLNIPKLQEIVIQRATPGHPQYQQWLSFEEVGTMVRNEEGYGKVMEWLEAYEVDVKWSSPYGEYIRAEGRISQWEKMLSTEFYEFEDLSHKKGESDKGKMFYRALEYWIPSELKESINAVFHTVHTPPHFKPKYRQRLPKLNPHSIFPFIDTPFKTHLRADHITQLMKNQNDRTNSVELDQIGSIVNIAFLDSTYKISSNIGSSKLNQSVFETSDEYFVPSDLTLFQSKNNAVSQKAISIGNHSIASCTGANTDCGEGNLDIQFIMGVAQKTASIYWWVSDASDPFVTWIQDVAAESNPPQANSISWGEIETFLSSSVVTAWETEASKLAGRGVTITVSSGDDGAPNANGANVCLCSQNHGYNPSFPATSQWVTAVGATMGPETGSAEVVCSSSNNGVITSGGGFSVKVSRPSWQNNAVNYYLTAAAASTSPPTSVGYNNTIGVSNIYNATFNDVTSGNTKCCASGSSPSCCSSGFTALKGWDPTTGWGSIDYTEFAAIFQVAASYNGTASSNSSGGNGTSLSSLQIGIIVLVILIALSFVYFAYNCFCRPKPMPQSDLGNVIMVQASLPTPAYVQTQVQNPSYVQNPTVVVARPPPRA
eukprot:gene4441-4761_t